MTNTTEIADQILAESASFIPLDEFVRGHRGDLDAAVDDLIANAEERVVTKAEANDPGVRDELLLAVGRVQAAVADAGPAETAALEPAVVPEPVASRALRSLRAGLDDQGDGAETPLRLTGDSVVRTYADGSVRRAIYIDASVPGAGYGSWVAFGPDDVLLVGETLEEVL